MKVSPHSNPFEISNGFFIYRLINKKWVSYFHRTATTAYPCYVPILGDSAGAGRGRLTRRKITLFLDYNTAYFDKNDILSYI